MSRAPAVPAGTVLSLGVGEWRTPSGEVGRRPALIRVVAVDQEASGGTVNAHGHTCNPHQPDCGSGHCWEGRILVTAIRDEMEAAL